MLFGPSAGGPVLLDVLFSSKIVILHIVHSVSGVMLLMLTSIHPPGRVLCKCSLCRGHYGAAEGDMLRPVKALAKSLLCSCIACLSACCLQLKRNNGKRGSCTLKAASLWHAYALSMPIRQPLSAARTVQHAGFFEQCHDSSDGILWDPFLRDLFHLENDASSDILPGTSLVSTSF